MVGVLVDDVLGNQQERCRSITLRGAVEQTEGSHDHRRVEDLFDGDLVAQLGLRVGHGVLVVLHRDHRQVLAGRG
jgi:hypothetical protein